MFHNNTHIVIIVFFFFFFFSCSIHKESIVDIEGLVSAAPEKITGCTQQDVEISLTKVSGKELVLTTCTCTIKHNSFFCKAQQSVSHMLC